MAVAHELGHLNRRDAGGLDVRAELAADQFAVELLGDKKMVREMLIGEGLKSGPRLEALK